MTATDLVFAFYAGRTVFEDSLDGIEHAFRPTAAVESIAGGCNVRQDRDGPARKFGAIAIGVEDAELPDAAADESECGVRVRQELKRAIGGDLRVDGELLPARSSKEVLQRCVRSSRDTEIFQRYIPAPGITANEVFAEGLFHTQNMAKRFSGNQTFY